ncbi:hypothetical protein PR048_028279 [Dryococelus australis]|uniref:Uncharacterized protein n=1 Tax=Dryococelus australis TaxID=614101 RepID=A0ABQ9GIW6_9NEOP|nr:hypothetical protein PR048_028279 [Dryococelus australis]
MEQRRNAETGYTEIPEKTCQPVSSSSPISTCENPAVTRPGIEPGFEGFGSHSSETWQRSSSSSAVQESCACQGCQVIAFVGTRADLKFCARGGNSIAHGSLLYLLVEGVPGGRAVSPLASHQGEPDSIPGPVTRFSHVGIVPDDAVGQRVFLGISRFHCSLITTLLHTQLHHPHRFSRPR